jgi:hypothetical protein
LDATSFVDIPEIIESNDFFAMCLAEQNEINVFLFAMIDASKNNKPCMHLE